CLYHGNLEIEENEYAILWLLKNVFKDLDIPLVIAGKNPSKKIIAAIKKYANASLIANPGEAQMHEIILKAHIHVLPSFNTTGIKIKLLNALYNGRHCVANNSMIAETSFKNLCHIVDTANEFKERIQLLYHQPFTAAEKDYRIQFLQTEFSNKENAKQIVQWIWKDYV
ncbi:MAG: glycosyltransferase family 4 protein, partial [Parafilimonas sp.]